MIHTCTELIHESRNIVVLTGAGISTESGIRDFRSQTGIYQMAPEYILSLDYFYNHPKEFYQFADQHLYHPNAVPNRGHSIIAKWEKEGKVSKIITQNIDGLHQKAGSNDVIEFHGTMSTAACLNCRKIYPTEEMVQRMRKMENFYLCDHCTSSNETDRYIKPNVVLFGDAGEWFSIKGFQTIESILAQADCLLVLGSSLKVTPFSTFPSYRKEGTPMIIINKGDTPYDHQRDTFVIHESIGETLSIIDESLERR